MTNVSEPDRRRGGETLLRMRAGDPPPAWPVPAKLTLLRDVLSVDVAILSEIRDGREIVREAGGSWPGVGRLDGASLPLEDTFCGKFLRGEIPNFVVNASADERVRDLGMAIGLGVETWLGAPVRGANARLYMLCCLARERRADLSPGDLRILHAFAESVEAEFADPPER
jgi:GAF domain-containing protein